MKIRFFGAAREVGRSCILIESEGTKVLLDAGVKLGANIEFPLIEDSELKSIDAIVLSHAHLDHTGYIAHIFSAGYEGYVYSTKPTFELAKILINDYMRISNPTNVTKEGIAKMERRFKLIEYHKEVQIKNLKFRFIPAGHILGSAMVEIYDKESRLLYTGDINLRTSKLLDAAQVENLKVQTIITESTYSGEQDVYESEKVVLDRLVASINDTIKRNGKVIMPTSGVGKAQEVLLLLDDYMKSGRLSKAPIYIDGMIKKVMRIHRHNVVYCRDELQKRILMNADDPFESINFKGVNSKAERLKVMKEHSPSIIVTTSGMLTGGPILTYLKYLSGQEYNKLIIVGYQAEGTLGRKLLEHAKEIEIDGRKVQVKLDIETHKISGHADRQQLLGMIGRLKSLKNIFIVHGEETKSAKFMEDLKGKYNVILPNLKEEYNV